MNKPLNIVLVRYRLCEWGKWYNRVLTSGLYFSNQSSLDWLYKNGGLLIPSTATPLVPDDPETEAVDQAITTIANPMPNGIGRPQWAKVVRIHYSSFRHTDADKIQLASLSRAAYYRYLRRCEQHLSRVLVESSACMMAS